jgi:hypothetical protein
MIHDDLEVRLSCNEVSLSRSTSADKTNARLLDSRGILSVFSRLLLALRVDARAV